MRILKTLYYFCGLGKKSANMEKIRHYCSQNDCPHLKTRARKNKTRKEREKSKKGNSQG